jgi:hypothetical protein
VVLVIHSSYRDWSEEDDGQAASRSERFVLRVLVREAGAREPYMLRAVDRFVDLSDVRAHLATFYSTTGRPSVDPELLIRMLIIGYYYAIRSERRLCEEVHLNLAYRWFCRLGLAGEVPDHSTFSKNPPWPLPRERSPAPYLRGGGTPLHRRGVGGR